MRWLFAVCVLLALVPLAGCAERSFDPIPSADWKPGYTFGYGLSAVANYTSTFTENGKPVGDQHNPDGADASGVLAYRVLNTQMTDAGAPIYLVALTGNSFSVRAGSMGTHSSEGPPSTGLVAMRQSDLQPLRTIVTTACPACQASAPTIRFESDGDDYSWIKFPLVYGDTWLGQVPVSSLFGDDNSYDVKSEVHGLRTVEGPTGKLDAVRITHTYSDPDAAARKDKTLAIATKNGIQVNAYDLAIDLSAELYYAPALHNVVLGTQLAQISLHVDFVQDDNHFVGDLHGSATLTQRLLSADLTEGPQLSLPQAIAALDQPIDLPVPSSGGGPAPGTLKVTADQDTVNAAEEPTVHFRTATTGTAHATAYRIEDAAGQLVASGAGGDFDFQVLEPGTYSAIVTGTDNSGRSLQARATLTADYKATLAAECPVVSAVGLLPCKSVAVPVRAGIRHLEVTATRTPLAGEPGLGELYLTSPAGSYQSATMSGNSATITVDTFDDADLGDWTVEYQPLAGVAENVAYTVQALHSSGGSAGSDFWAALSQAAVPALPQAGLAWAYST